MTVRTKVKVEIGWDGKTSLVVVHLRKRGDAIPGRPIRRMMKIENLIGLDGKNLLLLYL
jgi:hypothetical protein